MQPLRISADELRKRLAQEPLASAMANAWRVTGLEGFLSHYVARDSLTRSIVKAEGSRLNSDDQNVVEFAFARSLGQGGLFQTDELRALAEQRGENRPALEGTPPDWDLVHWQNLSRRTEEGLGAPATATTVEEARRFAAHQAFLNGELRQVFQAWSEGPPWTPAGPLELAMIGEALADAGSATALEFVEKLRPYQPAEADAILARYLWSQGKFKECYEATAAALVRYRQDPWPMSPLMQRLLAIAADLPVRDPAFAPLVWELLSHPLPLALLDDERLLTRVVVARYLGTARQAEAFEALEPHFPWSYDLLDERARVYESVGHPHAKLARKELEAFLARNPTAFAQGLEMPAPQ